MNLNGNLSMREALRVAQELGFTVTLRADSEYVFAHPLLFRNTVVNARRKDTPRSLMKILRQVSRGKFLAAPEVGKYARKAEAIRERNEHGEK